MEWSALSFEDYILATAQLTVSCTGTDGIASGTFRLELDTSEYEYATVKVRHASFGTRNPKSATFGHGNRRCRFTK